MPVVDALRARLGPDRVLVAEAARGPHRDSWVMSILEEVHGAAPSLPACVVRPQTTAEVVEVVKACGAHGAPLVPFGLGSGVCGGIRPSAESVVLDLGGLHRVRTIDVANLTATFEAGMRGSEAEAAVNRAGLTIGHFPQSHEVSSVGGWVATRSSGQLSNRYGNIEDLILGLEVVLPSGEVLTTPVTPRASIGPSLVELFLGSEGTLGVITAVVLSLHRAPERREVTAWYARDFEAGVEAVRAIHQAGWSPAVSRLLDPGDARRLLPTHARGGQSLLLFVHEGPARLVEVELEACSTLARGAGCEPAPAEATSTWLEHRNQVPSFPELIRQGIVFDTIDLSSTWDKVVPLYRAFLASVGSQAHLLLASAHVSHAYRSGANLYLTFALRPPEPSAMREAYWGCWREVMARTLEVGGCISHHHGIGRVRLGWMEAQLGTAGVGVLRNLKTSLDPQWIMNPGVVVQRG
jgi:alkyldihydroxyacetonephosphate synthase